MSPALSVRQYGVCAVAALVLTLCTCHDPVGRGDMRSGQGAHLDTRIRDYVRALGNLRGGRVPTSSEVELSRFLFGVEPAPPPMLVKPVSVHSRNGDCLVCDVALRAVLRWDRDEKTIVDVKLNPAPSQPIDVEATADGGMFVVDAGQGAVLQYGSDGALVRRLKPANGAFRPAHVLISGNELWVSNPAQHRIEVFGAQTGDHLRSIGRRGDGHGEFGIPLGMAHSPQGHVLVVDMLNARVQLLDQRGQWIRTVGGPGRTTGAFGRPKDVAVGPDGTVFVTDAAAQCVHAFDAEGRPLLSFGQVDGSDDGMLAPAGVAIARNNPMPQQSDLNDFNPDYYVLVTEQVTEPGVRVFAWRGKQVKPERNELENEQGDLFGLLTAPGTRNAAGTLNPHWSVDDCQACHNVQSGQVEPIPADEVDAGCLACHDGEKAFAEPHPIGRLVSSEAIDMPSWPLIDERLSCVTCHDISRHCAADPSRPRENPGMLRGNTHERSAAFCANCHIDEPTWQNNPHRAAATEETGRTNCLLCHTQVPEVPSDGQRRFEPMLHDESSDGCLRCHTVHWDYAPGGHLGKEVPEQMLVRLRHAARRAFPSIGEQSAIKHSPVLPLANGRMTCYTCHNPHPPELFPDDSLLGRRARQAADARLALRARQIELCLSCHDQ